ncbi:protein of unknown function DUF305 [Kribbella flavida DSM 17836]|uniref:DUF305 domain-containing protein n=1 Tax=Kribbella flavida (strain DSM 17836 / JCM 10339 / NBRC 14399) TaxID=479435 RepID=D2PLJ4_KRIFD|nr:DUF305 domain-containing protein [Kribbella flavida]ADB30623.1 protein of unknown function DUF305 [Kribbella flavida DSM 17836]
MRHHLWRTAAPTALLVLAGLALAGCGDNSDSGTMPGMDHGAPSSTQSSSAPAAGDFNDADVTFATQMIPHHQQAVQMANMADYNASAPAVKKLAKAIRAAQGPEIKTLSAWLTSWGKPVPTPSHGDHSAHEMPGMLSEDELSDLGNASGSTFDRLWAQQMIKHHQGAIGMAKAEQTGGRNAGAVDLARKIATDQAREIAALQRLLARLPAD